MQLNMAAAQGMPAAGQTTVEVADQVFARAYNEPLVHQVVTAYLAAGRAGTKAQKSRGDVRGGGKKPWKQKGTGRARAGSIRSPLWRGGGVTFAARPRSYAQKLNKKMYRQAMQSILSELVRQERLVVVQDFAVAAPKTREFMGKLRALGLERALVVIEHADPALSLAARNVCDVDVQEASRVDPVSLVGFDKVVITVPAVKRLEELLR